MTTSDGKTAGADVAVCNAAAFLLVDLLGEDVLPVDYVSRTRTPLPNLLLAGAWTGRFGQTAALRSGYQAGLRAAKVGPDMA